MFSQKEKLDKRNLSLRRARARFALSCLGPTGSSQQYMGQEEYYSEQYSHGQGSSEPMNQQYYPDGNSPELESLRYWSRVDQHDCRIQGPLRFISDWHAGKLESQGVGAWYSLAHPAIQTASKRAQSHVWFSGCERFIRGCGFPCHVGDLLPKGSVFPLSLIFVPEQLRNISLSRLSLAVLTVCLIPLCHPL